MRSARCCCCCCCSCWSHDNASSHHTHTHASHLTAPPPDKTPPVGITRSLYPICVLPASSSVNYHYVDSGVYFFVQNSSFSSSILQPPPITWAKTTADRQLVLAIFVSRDMLLLWFTSPPGGSRSIVARPSVCLPVLRHTAYLESHMSELRRSFLYMLHMAVARSSDGVAIRYVLPVFGMTSCFHTETYCTSYLFLSGKRIA